MTMFTQSAEDLADHGAEKRCSLVHLESGGRRAATRRAQPSITSQPPPAMTSQIDWQPPVEYVLSDRLHRAAPLLQYVFPVRLC